VNLVDEMSARFTKRRRFFFYGIVYE